MSVAKGAGEKRGGGPVVAQVCKLFSLVPVYPQQCHIQSMALLGRPQLRHSSSPDSDDRAVGRQMQAECHGTNATGMVLHFEAIVGSTQTCSLRCTSSTMGLSVHDGDVLFCETRRRGIGKPTWLGDLAGRRVLLSPASLPDLLPGPAMLKAGVASL